MKTIKDKLYVDIKSILEHARNNAVRAVNFSMVMAYWEIGRRIVEEEQQGKKRVTYGESVLKELSKKLISDFGKGFSVANLENYRKFYLLFSENQKSNAARWELENEQNQKLHALRAASQKRLKSSIQDALRPELKTELCLNYDFFD